MASLKELAYTWGVSKIRSSLIGGPFLEGNPTVFWGMH